jgi:hypothetical protein
MKRLPQFTFWVHSPPPKSGLTNRQVTPFFCIALWILFLITGCYAGKEAVESLDCSQKSRVEFSQDPTSPSGPLIPSVSLLDFGNLAKAESRQESFWIQNTGRTAIEVVGVKTTCDCYSIELERPTIQPGTSVRAIAKLDLTRDPDFAGSLAMDATAYAKSDFGPKEAFTIEARANVGLCR